MKYKSLKEIGAYYNEAHFLRPLKAHLVDDYADLMKDGVEFPPITLGEYPNGKVIVDGVHTFRAAGMAMINRVAVTVIQYKSLADALADQLKRNVNHGMRLLPGERDARIRMLHEIYKWNGVKIGGVVACLGITDLTWTAKHYRYGQARASPFSRRRGPRGGRSWPFRPTRFRQGG